MATEPYELKTLHAREYAPWGAHAAKELEQRDNQQCFGLSGASAGLLNSHIAVLVGGRELPFEAFRDTSRFDLFDLQSDRWLKSYDVDGCFASRIGHSVVTVHDRAFVFGGERVSSGAEIAPQPASADWNAFFNDVHELSFSNNVLRCRELSFSAAAPQDVTGVGGDGGGAMLLPCERAWHASARAKYFSSSTTGEDSKCSEDAVLTLGGKDATGKLLSDVWLLVLEKMVQDRSATVGVVAEDPVTDDHNGKESSLGVFTPRWIQLSPTGSSPLPLAYHSAVPQNDGTQIVVLGGKQSVAPGGPMLENVFVLDLVGNAWSTLSLTPSLSSSSASESFKTLTARCCFTALSLVLPIEEPNGKIVQFTEEIPLEALDEKRKQLAHEVIFIYGGFSELSPAMSTTSCVLLDVANSSIRELLTPNVGLTSYIGHAWVSSFDRQSMYLFGGIDPRTNQFIDATSALHFWRPQPFIDGLLDDDGASANAIKTKHYDNGDVYVGEMDTTLSISRRHGQGKCTYANGDEYDGVWDCNQRCGQGTMTYSNGDVYVGEWEGDQRHRYGILQRHVGSGQLSSSSQSKKPPRVEVKHEGHWRNDHKYGDSTTTYSDNSKLVATWASGGVVQHGRIDNFDDGNGLCSYTGQVASKDGLPEGEGTSKRTNGSEETYCGQWHLGRRSGHGVMTLLDGTKYTGDWRNGKRNGFGTCEYARSRDVYRGKWVGGVRCGRGVCTYANGSSYDGEWKDDKCHGHGRFTFANRGNSSTSSGSGGGVAFYEGSWKENKFCGDGALVLNLDADDLGQSGGGELAKQ